MSEKSTERRTRPRQTVNPVDCAECGRMSDHRWAGWRAYRTDDLSLREPPTLAFYCPVCAEREFGDDA